MARQALHNKSIKRILIVYKRSVYQKYVLEEGHSRLKDLLRRQHVTARTLVDAHERNQRALDFVITELGKHGVPYDVETRHRLKNLEAYDMIFSVGGDGTFLRTSHLVKKQLIMGINSTREYSVGALCSVTHDKFRSKLEDIMAGNYRIMRIPRMQIKINGKLLPIFATNDVLYTNHSPAATSRYIIIRGKRMEEHKSSGIWIATALGSTAAIHAAGGTKQKRTERKLQFRTREPYQGIYSPYKLVGGFISAKQKLTIHSKMVHAMLFVDGPNDAYRLHFGDTVEFSPAAINRDLAVIV